MRSGTLNTGDSDSEGGNKAGKTLARRQKVPRIRDNTGADIYEPSK